MVFKIAITVAAILAIVLLVFAGQNFQSVNFNLFGGTVAMPAALPLIGAWLAGLTAAGAVWQTRVSQVRHEKALQKWDVQDAKLAKEIESDKIKLLEAKIDTLNEALKKAIKKA